MFCSLFLYFACRAAHIAIKANVSTNIQFPSSLVLEMTFTGKLVGFAIVCLNKFKSLYTLHLHTHTHAVEQLALNSIGFIFLCTMSASRSMKTTYDYTDFTCAKWTISSCVGWSCWHFAFWVLQTVLSAWLPALLKIMSALTLTGWDWMRSFLVFVLHF